MGKVRAQGRGTGMGLWVFLPPLVAARGLASTARPALRDRSQLTCPARFPKCGISPFPIDPLVNTAHVRPYIKKNTPLSTDISHFPHYPHSSTSVCYVYAYVHNSFYSAFLISYSSADLAAFLVDDPYLSYFPCRHSLHRTSYWSSDDRVNLSSAVSVLWIFPYYPYHISCYCPSPLLLNAVWPQLHHNLRDSSNISAADSGVSCASTGMAPPRPRK